VSAHRHRVRRRSPAYCWQYPLRRDHDPRRNPRADGNPVTKEYCSTACGAWREVAEGLGGREAGVWLTKPREMDEEVTP